MSDWYLYIIRLRRGSLYTGISKDVDRRFSEHAEGGKKGSKYLRGRGPLELVFSAKIGNRSSASKLEAVVKKLPPREKEKIIAGDTNIESFMEDADESTW